MRWDEKHKNIGVDPDVYVVEPPPPEGDALTSILLWKEGHHAPALAIEVVSPGHPTKDYAPDRYAACGVGELWTFDPFLAGPKALGSVRLQIWRKSASRFERVYFGDGPAFSPYLGAWLIPTDEGARLRIADDADGTRWWLTDVEAKEQRIRELEEQLRQK